MTLTSLGMNLAAGKLVIRKKLRQRTVLLNAFKCHLAEFGLIAPQGPRKVMELIAQMRENVLRDLPEIALTALVGIGAQLEALTRKIRARAKGARRASSG